VLAFFNHKRLYSVSRMLDVLFPFSYFGICLGFLIGVGITVTCFGFVSAGIIILCIFFGMIRIMPLVNFFKKCMNILAPNQIEQIKENIGESFKLKKMTLEDKTYIYMWHPHGVFCSSMFFHNGTSYTNANLKAKGTAFNGLLWLPFMNEFFEELGAIPTEYFTMKSSLEKNESISVSPGGMREMLYKDTAIIEKRRGIFKMALETGTPLVPILSVNEDSLCELVEIPSWIQDSLERFDICICIPTLKSVYKLISLLHNPLEDPIYSIMGEPILVDKKENPSEKDISDLREKYIRALKVFYKKETLKELKTR